MEMIKISKVPQVQAISMGGATFIGTLHLTNHHLVYSSMQTAAAPGSPAIVKKEGSKPQVGETWITYHIISNCTFRPTPPGSGLKNTIRLRGRDFNLITFNFDDIQQARDVFDSIKALTCKLGRIEKLYAFSYKGSADEKAFNGWELYDAKAEWRRQGISEKGIDRGWRISRINVDYAFCSSYPALLPVPSTVSDNVLNYAGNYRSKARIPVLTYLHPINNCSITRSAQPKTGLRSNRSIQDEKLVGACFSATTMSDDGETKSTPRSRSPSQLDLTEVEVTDSERLEDELIASVPGDGKTDQVQIYGAQRRNLIVDARPTVNALAQQAVGLGSENMDNYKFAAKAYLGIANIHVMRDSLNKVVEAIKDGDLTPLPPNREMLAKSDWLKHIGGILEGASLIARQVGIQHSHVLIHCSDGWDRTSQLSALSQILLDPYFRTLDGFIVLVEKDWLAFGHMFQHRNGYLGSEKWFVTQSDGLAGSAIQPGSSDGRSDVLEKTLARTKRLFAKKNDTDEVDSDGEPIPIEDSPNRKRVASSKGTLAEQEATKVNETSPVFHQFLDAVYQLVRQHPTRFEYNERFLRRLLYHLYSCQYGTFLYNNEKARLDANVKEKTRSIWDYFLSRRADFVNKDYDGMIDDHKRGHERLLFPKPDQIKWWHELFGRKDEDMNGPFNAVIERYHGAGPAKSGPTSGVITGAESPSVALGSSTPRLVPNGSSTGLAGLRESISNLSIGKGKSIAGNKSPGRGKQEMEVEMQ